MWIGNTSFAAVSANSGERAGLRIVAYTVWPARATVKAVVKPMPALVPVISTEAMVALLKFVFGGSG